MCWNRRRVLSRQQNTFFLQQKLTQAISRELRIRPAGDSFANLDKRTRLIEARIAELSNEQKSSTELIKSLAEQNALIVEAIDVFRVRVKILLVVCISLVGVLAGLVFWLVMDK